MMGLLILDQWSSHVIIGLHQLNWSQMSSPILRCFIHVVPDLYIKGNNPVCEFYLWHPKVTDVLKVRTEDGQLTLHPLILAPHSLHFLEKKKKISVWYL